MGKSEVFILIIYFKRQFSIAMLITRRYHIFLFDTWNYSISPSTQATKLPPWPRVFLQSKVSSLRWVRSLQWWNPRFWGEEFTRILLCIITLFSPAIQPAWYWLFLGDVRNLGIRQYWRHALAWGEMFSILVTTSTGHEFAKQMIRGTPENSYSLMGPHLKNTGRPSIYPFCHHKTITV